VPDSRRPSLARYDGKEIVLGARPEHIRITAPGQDRSPEAVDFTIDVTQNLGYEVLLDIVAGSHRAVTRVVPDDFAVEGTQRSFDFDMTMVYFFDPETGVNISARAS
jgi:multiple sugar transport system ATP-binding protein